MELMKLIPYYELYIIDMDGTLYYQNKLRVKLIAQMFKQLFTNRRFPGELYVVYRFRRLREQIAGGQYDDEGLCNRVAKETSKLLKFSQDDVKTIINKWIYEMPLPLLKDCRDERLIDFIKTVIVEGKKVYIYSDYPAKNKAQMLGIKCDGVEFLDASDSNVNAYKPSPKGVEYILNVTGVEGTKAIVIGDRDSRDGLAAKNAGIAALILKKRKSKRYKNG